MISIIDVHGWEKEEARVDGKRNIDMQMKEVDRDDESKKQREGECEPLARKGSKRSASIGE